VESVTVMLHKEHAPSKRRGVCCIPACDSYVLCQTVTGSDVAQLAAAQQLLSCLLRPPQVLTTAWSRGTLSP
jgi:hypothetical protein